MIENAPAMLAERWASTLPAHVLQSVLLEPELFGSLGCGEQLLSSPVGHVAFPEANGTGQKLRENVTQGECRTGVGARDTPGNDRGRGTMTAAREPKSEQRVVRGMSASWLGLANELAGIDVECLRYPAENAYACRNVGALDLADVARADAGSVGEFLLRQFLVMTHPTQVHRHDLLEVHGAN